MLLVGHVQGSRHALTPLLVLMVGQQQDLVVALQQAATATQQQNLVVALQQAATAGHQRTQPIWHQ